uniref:Uncharacterized protein n=2 Tax=Caenorhabditis japonica TaxID=281687 RepID=A0A8R1ERW4_CAEJA
MLPDIIPRIQQNLVHTHNTDVVKNIFSKLSISVHILKSNLTQFDEKDNVASRIVNTYSYSLEKHLRTVLQSVPNHLLGIMYQVIMPALTRKFQPYVEKTELREVSEFIYSSKLVESTCLIANTSMGISRMMLTKVGTVEINPKVGLWTMTRKRFSLSFSLV